MLSVQPISAENLGQRKCDQHNVRKCVCLCVYIWPQPVKSGSVDSQIAVVTGCSGVMIR